MEGAAAATRAGHSNGDGASPSLCGCAIEHLKQNTFSSLSFEEKSKIIATGKPTPELHIECHSKGKKNFIRHFRAQIYENVPWISGCRNTNKLFCWPCLLFSKEKSVWTQGGFDDLHNIHKAQARHETSVSHILSLKNFKLFGKQRIECSLSEQFRLSVQRHNVEVSKNRDMLTHIIRVVCLLGKLGLAFRGHNEIVESHNRGNYIEILKFLGNYNTELLAVIESNNVFRGTSPDVQNDIIAAVAEVMHREIEKEISEAQFVALIFDETTDVTMKSQLTSVLRYVSKNGVQERFLHFTDCSKDRSASGLLEHAKGVISTYKCDTKVIAQTYDGAAVMAGEHAGLQAKLKMICKEAIFVHCYAHKLNLVLGQSASCIKEVRIFFASLSGLGAFFSKSTRRIEALDTVVKKRLPSAAPTRWNFTSRLVLTVKNHTSDLQELFASVTENSSDWDAETLCSARGYFNLLKDFDFNFFLTLFSCIFPHSDSLFKILQNKSNDIMYCMKKIEDFGIYLKQFRDTFECFWEGCNRERSEFQCIKRARVENTENEKNVYKRLFIEVIDNLICHVSDRFSDTSKLKFLSLLNPDLYLSYQSSFPSEAFNCLMDVYGRHFDSARLKSELTAIYFDNEFHKSVSKLNDYIKHHELADVFPQTYILTALILTIPATSASAERSFSALRRVKNYLRNSQSDERLSRLSLLNIESQLLDSMMTKPSFFNDVIDVYARKPRRIALNFKM